MFYEGVMVFECCALVVASVLSELLMVCWELGRAHLASHFMLESIIPWSEGKSSLRSSGVFSVLFY